MIKYPIHSIRETIAHIIAENPPTINQYTQPKQSLENLLAQSDFTGPRSADDNEWLTSPPVGRELV